MHKKAKSKYEGIHRHPNWKVIQKANNDLRSQKCSKIEIKKSTRQSLTLETKERVLKMLTFIK